MNKDFAPNERIAEAEKAEAAALVQQLRAKQHPPIKGELTPETSGQIQAEFAVLSGGPFAGLEIKTARGQAKYERPVASSLPDGNPFVPARYQRTGKRNEDGLAVFAFQEPAA